MSRITIVLHNGLNNRNLPLASVLRLAKKSNRKVNIIWTYTPVRSCLEYKGDLCKFNEIYKSIDGVTIDDYSEKKDQKIYEFKYWDNLDHVIDISGNNDIFINFALYPIISLDDRSDIVINTQNTLKNKNYIELDDLCYEIGDIMNNVLKPVDELQNEIDNYVKKFKKNMLGLHIRTTDGDFVNFNWKEIINKLIIESEKWLKKDSINNGLFLATDDLNVYIQLLCHFGNSLIFYNPPETLCNSKSSTKFNNDKYNVFVGLIELYLLSKCNSYIIGTSKSTFSFCAMLMAAKETKKYLINSIDTIPTL
jgi:hypothetical protein